MASGKRPIQTLFLDAGGVLLFPNWVRVAATLRRHGIPAAPEALRDAEAAVKFTIDDARRVAASTDADRGGELFEGVLDRIGVPRSPARAAALDEVYAYHATHNLWEDVPGDVRPALERFNALGLTLAVVSNANGLVARVFERAGLSQFFSTICDSCLEGVEKPDPRFFHLVLERTGGRPDTTLHVGDLYHVDVVGARRAGVQAMLLDPLGLYGAFDVERVCSLADLADRLERDARQPAPIA